MGKLKIVTMKKYYYLMPAALVLFVTACNTIIEDNTPQDTNPDRITYIRAEGGESAKASINNTDATFTWNTGDRIAVYSDGYKISDELSSTYNGTNSATFSFSGANAVEENERANFAVFPARLVYDSSSDLYTSDVTASSLKINLPASYTLDQVQDEVSPVPMIATNIKDGDLSFKSICALVRVSVENISKDAHHITVTFPGKKIQGEFTLTSVVPGTTGVVTAETDSDDDTITITDLGISSFTASLVVNVPVPTGVADTQEYNDIKVTVYDSDNHKINAITTPLKVSAGVPVAWVPGRKASKKVTASLPVFTVGKSTGKKVVFAPGNLQAVISTLAVTNNTPATASSWRFAAHQYDVVGNVNSNKNGVVGQPTDLFCWVGSSAVNSNYGLFIASTINSDYHGSSSSDNLIDWGNLSIGSFSPGTWRTPTYAEWGWVVGATYGKEDVAGTDCRTSSTVNGIDNARYAKAKVGSINGLILFPDNYVHPYSVSAIVSSSINNRTLTMKASDVSSGNVSAYSTEEWDKMEAAGCVFLPTTGWRNDSFSIGNVPGGDWEEGDYWSSSPNADVTKASHLSIQQSNIYPNGGVARWRGEAVRLVRDLN